MSGNRQTIHHWKSTDVQTPRHGVAIERALIPTVTAYQRFLSDPVKSSARTSRCWPPRPAPPNCEPARTMSESAIPWGLTVRISLDSQLHWVSLPFGSHYQRSYTLAPDASLLGETHPRPASRFTRTSMLQKSHSKSSYSRRTLSPEGPAGSCKQERGGASRSEAANSVLAPSNTGHSFSMRHHRSERQAAAQPHCTAKLRWRRWVCSRRTPSSREVVNRSSALERASSAEASASHRASA